MAARNDAFVKPCFELLRKKSSYPLISEGRRICQLNLLTLAGIGRVILYAVRFGDSSILIDRRLFLIRLNGTETTACLDIKMNGWVVCSRAVTIWNRICNIQRAALLPHHLKDRGSGTIMVRVLETEITTVFGASISSRCGVMESLVAMMRSKCTGRDLMLLQQSAYISPGSSTAVSLISRRRMLVLLIKPSNSSSSLLSARSSSTFFARWRPDAQKIGCASKKHSAVSSGVSGHVPGDAKKKPLFPAVP